MEQKFKEVDYYHIYRRKNEKDDSIAKEKKQLAQGNIRINGQITLIHLS
jgi:hypothetical protein